ncbi:MULTISPECIES: sterol desaturase family protein [Methylomonas]|uniref:Sterol desaturase n=2 Tax=Methylomonas TaxID=416 RepID=A0A126T2Q7_9GAMM|nr:MULTISPECIES: sterol desaturase family protein [Methylomonas]AMK76370.1 sterol desaturase [Methylomonas denitrificans]OAI00512.1 sterol desaturase [Methylomonas methanica]TCV88397.1 sterol desaturase/sphingolipid hydroxylase (fatty acid hydroxylase superfamily) [Methylomonas methanica]
MEAMVRLGVFLGIFLVMAAWELWRPKRQLSLGRRRRWPVNLGLAVLNVGVMRSSIGAAAWLAATWAAEQQIGLFNLVPVPHWLSVALSLLLLDLAIYAQHLAAHRWRWFWCLHQVHHSDMDFDATTAVRFHPLEIMLSMLYKVVLVVLLGADPVAVIAFEVILNGCALFNHGNVGLPPVVERWLRYALVTPDMHRIHHSAFQPETDSNYGFSLSCWDRLFKTYCGQARETQTEMTIGLYAFRDSAELGFFGLLALPFRRLRAR